MPSGPYNDRSASALPFISASTRSDRHVLQNDGRGGEQRQTTRRAHQPGRTYVAFIQHCPQDHLAGKIRVAAEGIAGVFGVACALHAQHLDAIQTSDDDHIQFGGARQTAQRRLQPFGISIPHRFGHAHCEGHPLRLVPVTFVQLARALGDRAAALQQRIFLRLFQPARQVARHPISPGHRDDQHHDKQRRHEAPSQRNEARD
jgi:hypothetical protein